MYIKCLTKYLVSNKFAINISYMDRDLQIKFIIYWRENYAMHIYDVALGECAVYLEQAVENE